MGLGWRRASHVSSLCIPAGSSLGFFTSSWWLVRLCQGDWTSSFLGLSSIHNSTTRQHKSRSLKSKFCACQQETWFLSEADTSPYQRTIRLSPLVDLLVWGLENFIIGAAPCSHWRSFFCFTLMFFTWDETIGVSGFLWSFHSPYSFRDFGSANHCFVLSSLIPTQRDHLF